MSVLSYQLNYIYSYGTKKTKMMHLLLTSLAIAFLGTLFIASYPVVFNANTTRSFTDIFNTQSFRGSFEWIYKFDWLGGIVQFVISIFSLVGVILIALRVISSYLYISSKNIWDEVSDLKKTGGDTELYDLGFLGQLKKVTQGKQGTGVDAFMGFLFMFLPDIKKYSDFAEGKKDSLDEGLSATQYTLKIAVPVVMCTFFFAMGFNGTLFRALGITVEALGTVADKAVSQNYAAMLDRLIVTGDAYDFAISKDGTKRGEFQYQIARELYTDVLQRVDKYNTNMALSIGQQIEERVIKEITADKIGGGSPNGHAVKLSKEDLTYDSNWGLLGYEIVINTTKEYSSAAVKPISHSLWDWAGGEKSGIPKQGKLYGKDLPEMYAHVFVTQTKNKSSLYFAPMEDDKMKK